MPYVERRIETRVGRLVPDAAATVFAPLDCTDIGVTHAGNVPDLLWVRLDGQEAQIETDDNYLVLPGQTRWIPRPYSMGEPSEVSLKSRGSVLYEIEFP